MTFVRTIHLLWNCGYTDMAAGSADVRRKYNGWLQTLSEDIPAKAVDWATSRAMPRGLII